MPTEARDGQGPGLPVPHHRGPVHRIGHLELSEHRFRVPLAHAWDWSHPEGPAPQPWLAEEEVRLFARVVTSRDPQARLAPQERPWLVYLQGGPGMPAPRPASPAGWVELLSRDYRIVLLDQRGTGLSTPLTARTLARLGGPERQAAYLEHFRADSVVADAEAVRATLLAEEKRRTWASLGQSFGGFITLSYLSFAPESLEHSWMTAGLAPIHATPRQVYEGTYAAIARRNLEYYDWYPENAERAVRIARLLEERHVAMPTGERLSPRRFQGAGMLLGGTGRVHQLHHLLESAFAEGPDTLSEAFLTQLSGVVGFSGHPLYALMHEAIYADGPGRDTAWAAEAVRSGLPEFAHTAEPLLFTGEMIHPWHFAEDPALIPLAEVAQILAAKDDWGRLYDQPRLAANEVPVAASAYRPDVFVEYHHAMRTAASVGSLRTWTSETLHHDALGHDASEVLHALGEILVEQGALERNPVPPRS